MKPDARVFRNSKYKLDDMVSIKIDRVDKKSPFHPNLLLRKVLEIEKNYVKVVTPLVALYQCSLHLPDFSYVQQQM